MNRNIIYKYSHTEMIINYKELLLIEKFSLIKWVFIIWDFIHFQILINKIELVIFNRKKNNQKNSCRSLA